MEAVRRCRVELSRKARRISHSLRTEHPAGKGSEEWKVGFSGWALGLPWALDRRWKFSPRGGAVSWLRQGSRGRAPVGMGETAAHRSDRCQRRRRALERHG